MKNTIINMQEMSDSKEVYGQRPNPFIAIFIYCLVGLLAAALIYSCFGKMEIVAKASGIIRPNENVSTVSGLLSGRVVGANYSDGQYVEAGDVLLSIDVSDKKISLNALERSKAEQESRTRMLEKFLTGIENNENPFSDAPSGKEYPYYIQFRDYALSLKNTKETFDCDADKAAANIQSINSQIGELSQKLAGLNSYKRSIQQGKNLASAYPEYERLYLLYVSSIEALDDEYQAQHDSISSDTTQSYNDFQLEQYQNQITQYQYLVQSIQQGQSVFPAYDSGTCKQLFDEYLATLAQYEQEYENAKKTYDLYVGEGEISSAAEDILAYDRTKLEGYNYYQQSVEMGSDMFDSGKDSVFYRSLYADYASKYDALNLEDPAQAEAFRTQVLTEISNEIMQITATIAEKEISYGLSSADFNAETAKQKMDAAKASVDAYKTKTLAQYQQALGECENKLAELQITSSSTPSKDQQYSTLDTSHNNTKEQKRLQTLTQIDASIEAAESELRSAQSNLRLYQAASRIYNANIDDSGTPVIVSLATIEQISSILSQEEALAEQIDDLDTQINQVKEQISQGTIAAEQSGIVSVNAVLVEGDTIASGAVIATIIPANESEYKVNLYVNNSDIANIEIGDKVRYNLPALPSNQYGLVEGEITKISSDTLVQDGQYSGYYLVECSIANTTLTDKDGNSGSVAIGMQVEAKIVTQKKTIIRYLLEKINLF